MDGFNSILLYKEYVLTFLPTTEKSLPGLCVYNIISIYRFLIITGSGESRLFDSVCDPNEAKHGVCGIFNNSNSTECQWLIIIAFFNLIIYFLVEDFAS